MPTTKFYQLNNSASKGFSWGKLEYFLIPRIFYYLFYFPLKAIFKLFSHFKVQTQEDLKNLQGPLVVVSSHASWIDPFLIGAAFPFLTKAAPIYYATWWKYYYFPIFTPLIWLFGGFPIRKGIGLDKALVAASKILSQGGIVGIFPAGKRTRKWNEPYQPRAKRGAGYLAIKNSAPILPIKIEGNVGMNFKSFLRRKYKIKVKIGKVFYLSYQDLNNPENLNYPANLIMNKITNL
ncbi:hypothetical protein AMJ47_01930 [Parcubacteria bacterium DG_72]|nr:MAG: hypothetical protein AMJ47_01930 [Parcubacteria bacterium DG_72]